MSCILCENAIPPHFHIPRLPSVHIDNKNFGFPTSSRRIKEGTDSSHLLVPGEDEVGDAPCVGPGDHRERRHERQELALLCPENKEWELYRDIE